MYPLPMQNGYEKVFDRNLMLGIRLLAACLLCFFSIQSTALEVPKGATILKVEGRLARTNQGTAAWLDLEALDALKQHKILTTTPWYDGERTFEGPLVRDLIKWLGAEGATVKAIALNDYMISIPVSDFRLHDVILATRIDGRALTVREKGPIFVMYPFDQTPSLRTEVHFQRCIWQLHRLIFED